MTVEEADSAEATANLDQLARRFVGLTGAEFRAAVSRGEFETCEPGVSRVRAVLDLVESLEPSS